MTYLQCLSVAEMPRSRDVAICDNDYSLCMDAREKVSIVIFSSTIVTCAWEYSWWPLDC